MAFILVAFGGSYEDTWRSNVVVSRDLHKIELLKEEKELKQKAIDEIRGKLEAFEAKWNAENPFDNSTQEKTVDIPKWPAGIDQRLITKEMRVERETIKKFNAEVNARNAARHIAYHEKKIQAEKQFLVSINAFDVINPEELGNTYSIAYDLYSMTDHQYEIEEVEEI